ncbi:MAG: transketolase family protein [Bacteroidota bacterium]
MNSNSDPKDQAVIAAIKGLVMDATAAARSGHPGGAFSSCDFAALLWMETLHYAPGFPQWAFRDRFVLSAGHESMLLYSLLHLAGMLSLDEIKRFRQLGSLTPGHPESHLTPGVEATTGPLGQGVAMGVGMAVAALQEQAQRLDVTTPQRLPRIWVLAGDGDLQEDVALGACQLAGHWGLGNLVLYYDKNDIQISGSVDRVSSVNFKGLFESMQWDVLEIDGHDHAAIRQALDLGTRNDRSKPLLILGQSTMAKGAATMEGLAKTHGEPLPAQEIAATKTLLGLNPEAHFAVNAEAYSHFTRRLALLNQEASTCTHSPSLPLPDVAWPSYETGQSLATRVAFGQALAQMGSVMSGLTGGSADLEPSNNTAAFAGVVGEFHRNNRAGRNLAFGVREFPMAAILNGMALYSPHIKPFGATFLTFSDYMRNAIRMSAIQKLSVLHVFTHDSIFLGEDGPTHQSVEHLMSLRAIPDLWVLRPADARETQACLRLWSANAHQPAVLALTRQNVPTLACTEGSMESLDRNVARGGYLAWEQIGHKQDLEPLYGYATGSEVATLIEACQLLSEVEGSVPARTIRIYSIPCWELLDQQPEDYRASIRGPKNAKRVSMEAGVTQGWASFTGLDGLQIGVDTFGYSAPGPDLARHFGLEAAQVKDRILAWLQILRN